MALKGRELKHIIMATALLVAVVVGLKLNEPDTPEGIERIRARTQREALHLPKNFDDTAQLDTRLIDEKKVRDWSVLMNYRQGKIDPAFWDCLDLVMKLSPEEIHKRAIDIDFNKFKEDSSLRPQKGEEISAAYSTSVKKAQDYRDSVRGKFIRVRGSFEPVSGDYHLPDNPSKRSLMRRFFLKNEKFDLLRSNIPEMYYVFALNDSSANYKDEVEVEGIFLKVVKYNTIENNYKSLPLLIARDVKVLKHATETMPVEKNESFFNKYGFYILSTIFMFCGLTIFSFLYLQNKKKQEFKDEVFNKINERKQSNDSTRPTD